MVALRNSFNFYQYSNRNFFHNWATRRNYKGLPSTEICRITVCNLAVSWHLGIALLPPGFVLRHPSAGFFLLARISVIDARRRVLKNP
jgi:hypothetical protein